MYANDQRIHRINNIKSWIKEAMLKGLVIDEKKLLAEILIGFGTSNRTGMEYLKGLEDSGFIIRIDGKIWSKEAYEIDRMLRLTPVTETNGELI